MQAPSVDIISLLLILTFTVLGVECRTCLVSMLPRNYTPTPLTLPSERHEVTGPCKGELEWVDLPDPTCA